MYCVLQKIHPSNTDTSRAAIDHVLIFYWVLILIPDTITIQCIGPKNGLIHLVIGCYWCGIVLKI